MSKLKVAIAGAGNVGRSLAVELIENGHSVLLIEREAHAMKTGTVAGARWVHGDACEMATLEQAGLADYDVVVAATGDDKANLVLSLLAKTEYAVARVIARVNHPKNEWLFDAGWGVDTAVSTPRMLTALIEEAVGVTELVRLLSFQRTGSALLQITLPPESPAVNGTIGGLGLPGGAAVVAVLRDGRLVLPTSDTPMESGDEVLVLSTDPDLEPTLAELFAATPGPATPGPATPGPATPGPATSR